MNKFFLNLGRQPLANKYLSKFNTKQKKYNLKLNFNTETKLVSISKRISSAEMFDDKYPYRSSMSKTMRNAFNKLSKEIKKKFNPHLLLEIGSNDGALIKNFSKKKTVGIEPCLNLAQITRKLGYRTYSEYWNYKLAIKIKKELNKVDLIYSANTLTHISNLDDVFKSINYVLSKNGILIIEDPSLLECIKQNAYDQFYNEHIYVFSTLSLKNILSKFNLEIFDIKNLETHGGSLRYYIKRIDNQKIKINNNLTKQLKKEINYGLGKLSTFRDFAKRVKKSKKKLIKIFKQIRSNKKNIIGYGATAKATTILNYCNINKEIINFFVDTTPEKINKFMPGKNIKIIKYNKKTLNNTNYVFLGAWNFKKEIMSKEKGYLKRGGKFITHVPFPKIYS